MNGNRQTWESDPLGIRDSLRLLQGDPVPYLRYGTPPGVSPISPEPVAQPAGGNSFFPAPSGSFPWGLRPSIQSPQFGQEYGAPMVPTPGPAPPPAEQPSEYENVVREYLGSLQGPANIPKPPPFTRAQRLALIWNPDREKEMITRFREPYQHEMATYAATERRRAGAAALASRLMESHERRKERQQQKQWQADLVNARAGNINWPYANRELESLAHQTRGDFEIIHPPGGRGRKTEAQRWKQRARVEDDLRATRALYLSNARDPVQGRWPGIEGIGDPHARAMMAQIWAHVEDLRAELAVLDELSDEEFEQLGPGEYEQLIEAQKRLQSQGR